MLKPITTLRLRAATSLLAAAFVCTTVGTAEAADPPAAAASASAAATNPQFKVRPADDAWRAALPRDADAATRAYLARLPSETVARANAYFEGGYWLQLWNFLLGLAIAGVLLAGRNSARLRDFAQRIGRKAFFRDAIYGAIYAVAVFVLSLPLTIYQGYVREHAYGMATQTFGPWFAEQLIALAVNVLLLAFAVGVLYALFRRAGARWWVWGSGFGVVLLVLSLLVGPVWIDPLFNTYKPIADGDVKQAVLAMAHADGVPADNVYEFDASRQTTRVSANVAGIFGTASVRLNDNLMRKPLAEIRAVTGHELGHYVMNHIDKFVVEFAVVIVIGFAFSRWAMDRLLARHGASWGLSGVADAASFPLLMAVLSVYLFIATPVLNTMTRTQEIEADRFGLNLAREPHGFAEAVLDLTEYRKPDPGRWEEIIFYDHPSARFRIHDAMRWREAMGTKP
ncbi:MAG: M48 family metallopeptidase [Proteobacteria bacterium]|nr:M48 family metallopeptidase [Pseudomonadota bacterium]